MPPFFTEIQYDNDGSAQSDFIEIAIPASENPADFNVHLTDNNRRVDDSINLAAMSQGTSFTFNGVLHDVYFLTNAGSNGFSITSGEGVGITDGDLVTGTTLQLFSFGSPFQMRPDEMPPFSGETADPTSVAIGTTGGPPVASLQLVFQTPLDLENFVDTDTDPTRSPDPGTVVVCFCAGTKIETMEGAKDVARLKVGDMVYTQKNGPQPLRWIGHRKFGPKDLVVNPKRRPVRILKGALGNGLPKRDLSVSRQHRVLLRSKIAQRMFGTDDVLIPAIQLCSLPGVYVDEDVQQAHYIHLMFDHHEIVFAEGAPAESLYVGPEARKMIPPDALRELLELFPDLKEEAEVPEPAALIPSNRRQKRFVQRYIGRMYPKTREQGQPSSRV